MPDKVKENDYTKNVETKISDFFNRASHAQCVGIPQRTGSVTIIGTTSTPGGDFSEQVTTVCLKSAQTLWGLSKNLTEKKHFPSLDWNISYTKSISIFEVDDNKLYSEFNDLKVLWFNYT